jgi:predicted secreted protein
MSFATAGVGTIFQRWQDTVGDQKWVAIAEINSITGPSMSRDTIDVTSLSSTGGYREFIGGFRNPGTVQLSMNFYRQNYDLFKGDFESSTIQNYRIVLPDAESTSVEFEGLVTELPLTIPADDKITMDVTIQVSGAVESDSGASSNLGM